MLDQIDLELKLSKGAYHQRLEDLQARLYDMEQAMLESKVPVAIIFEGWAGTAKVRTISVLTRRLDPRGVRVHPITAPRTYETQYPWLYRFWLKIPSYGQVAIFDRSWYRQALAERTHGDRDISRWRDRCEDMAAFERQLAADGAVVLKFWLHISQKEQRHRFKRLLADPLTAWQVTEEDQWQHRNYDKVYAAVEDMIARTDTAYAPWQLIPATDKYYARIAVFESIVHALESRLGRPAVAVDTEAGIDSSGSAFHRPSNGHTSASSRIAAVPPAARLISPKSARPQAPLAEPGILQRVDLSVRLEEDEYTRRLKLLQTQTYMLGLEIYRQQRPVLIIFEGWDAAGKGGAIQRLTEKLDPRAYTVHAIAAPAGDDKIRHYLYRFWRRLPPRGAIGIFDRSWYGRVLVERVEGFARPDEWQRAYAEINEFERQLAGFGTIICKFWVHISPEEQLRRFEQRQNVPYKAWKLTDEDWRNREKWPLYEEAANEMLLRTSTPTAPWTIIESEDKRFGRIKVLQTVVSRLEAELGKVRI